MNVQYLLLEKFNKMSQLEQYQFYENHMFTNCNITSRTVFSLLSTTPKIVLDYNNFNENILSKIILNSNNLFRLSYKYINKDFGHSFTIFKNDNNFIVFESHNNISAMCIKILNDKEFIQFLITRLNSTIENIHINIANGSFCEQNIETNYNKFVKNVELYSHIEIFKPLYNMYKEYGTVIEKKLILIENSLFLPIVN